MSTVEERVKKIVVEQLGVKEEEVNIPHEVFWDDSKIQDIMLRYGKI